MKRTTPPRAGQGTHRNLAKEKFWRATLQRFATGGQGVRAFCASHNLSEPSFYGWRRTLAARPKATPPAPAVRPLFLPVHVRPGGQPAGRMEIVLGGGRRIRLGGPVDRQALADVLAVLTSADSVAPEPRTC